MRKLFVSNLISVDGYIAGPKGELDWHNVDAEFNVYAHSMLDSIDTILFGRVTYEMMAAFWPSAQALHDDPETAMRMNSISKVVCSRTLKNASWSNSRLVSRDIETEVRALKQQTGKGIVILGSGQIVSQLTDARLIDEYRFFVNPVILGGGIPEFGNLTGRVKLKLLSERQFKNGNVLLTYSPV